MYGTILAEVTATETCTVELTEDDFDSWPPTVEQVHAKAIEIFEMPDNAERTGADYDVRFDPEECAR